MDGSDSYGHKQLNDRQRNVSDIRGRAGNTLFLIS